eukprot:PhM_4_TR18744/c4_g2_i5/m.1468
MGCGHSTFVTHNRYGSTQNNNISSVRPHAHDTEGGRRTHPRPTSPHNNFEQQRRQMMAHILAVGPDNPNGVLDSTNNDSFRRSDSNASEETNKLISAYLDRDVSVASTQQNTSTSGRDENNISGSGFEEFVSLSQQHQHQYIGQTSSGGSALVVLVGCRGQSPHSASPPQDNPLPPQNQKGEVAGATTTSSSGQSKSHVSLSFSTGANIGVVGVLEEAEGDTNEKEEGIFEEAKRQKAIDENEKGCVNGNVDDRFDRDDDDDEGVTNEITTSDGWDHNVTRRKLYE